MSVQRLKLFQKNVSIIAVLTGAMVASQYAVGDPSPPSPECQGRFSENPAYLEICNQYPKGKVKVLSRGSDLSTQIEQEQEGWLLIIPSGTYSLTKPLKSKSGQGLLPDTGEGFIRLEPTGAYAIERDLFTVFEVGESSRQGGIEIDASSFTSSTAFTNAKTKVLMHSEGVKKFEATWMKLTGSDDLDKVVWGENNDVTVSNPEEVLQLITHSYIEGRGAETTVKLEVPSVDNPDKVEMVKVKRSVITVGGGRDSKHSKQEALHVVNGTGEIEHAHLAFREHTGSGTPERELLHLEDSNGIAVKEVVFYSEEKSKREKDWVFDLVKKQASEVKVSVLVNSGTDKANKLRSRDDSVTEVTGDVDENYQSDELLPLPTMDDFFKKGADAGNQLADRFVLQNILKAQEGANATNISSYYQKKWLVDDSGIVFKSNSDSETLCFRVETVILSGWIAFGIENIAILGYVIYAAGSLRNGVKPRPHRLYNYIKLNDGFL